MRCLSGVWWGNGLKCLPGRLGSSSPMPKHFAPIACCSCSSCSYPLSSLLVAAVLDYGLFKPHVRTNL